MYIGIFYFRQTSRYCNEMNAKTSDFYSVVPFILILEMANPTCPLRAHCRTHILRDSMQ